MNTIVNKDIRWGFMGIQINRDWVLTNLSEGWADDDYDMDKDLDEDEEIEFDDILRNCASMVERHINCAEYSKISDTINEMYSDCLELFKKEEEEKKYISIVEARDILKKNEETIYIEGYSDSDDYNENGDYPVEDIEEFDDLNIDDDLKDYKIYV